LIELYQGNFFEEVGLIEKGLNIQRTTTVFFTNLSKFGIIWSKKLCFVCGKFLKLFFFGRDSQIEVYVQKVYRTNMSVFAANLTFF